MIFLPLRGRVSETPRFPPSFVSALVSDRVHLSCLTQRCKMSSSASLHVEAAHRSPVHPKTCFDVAPAEIWRLIFDCTVERHRWIYGFDEDSDEAYIREEYAVLTTLRLVCGAFSVGRAQSGLLPEEPQHSILMMAQDWILPLLYARVRCSTPPQTDDLAQHLRRRGWPLRRTQVPSHSVDTHAQHNLENSLGLPSTHLSCSL